MKDQSPESLPMDRYRSLFDNSPDAILIIENDRFVDCNQAAVDMLGYTNKQSLLQCHPSELSPYRQSDGQRSRDKANSILAQIQLCRNQKFEWEHLRADGSLLPVEVSMTAIETEGVHTLHIVWRDISERRRLEKELRHAHKVETLGNLAGGIAHDFNNTLVPIVSYSELLCQRLKDHPELLKCAQEISRAGFLASSLVKKLLAVSRQDDRLPITIDLEAAVVKSLGLLRKLIDEDIELQVQRTNRALWIQTNNGDVEQVLLNLASNARDALPAGGSVVISLGEIERSGRSFAQLRFTDNGTGMDEETQKQVFDPFFTTKGVGDGTGLGMASVQELVTKSGGHVSVESSLGEGTTIELLFPIVKPLESRSALANGEEGANLDKPPMGENVLVVEDDVQISRLIFDALTQSGFHVRNARSGAEALEALERDVPDLVLVDVVMPRMSGPEMAKEMNKRGIHAPLLFMSGCKDDRLRVHGFDPQNVALIRKPFTIPALLRSVREALASNPTRNAGD